MKRHNGRDHCRLSKKPGARDGHLMTAAFSISSLNRRMQSHLFWIPSRLQLLEMVPVCRDEKKKSAEWGVDKRTVGNLRYCHLFNIPFPEDFFRP
ncbi:unnamed protein product [Nezara viridula]|uniref:Uncharacterized protein n=1 Tax=Nezara viridula TaxID=85310 RepID=A0A9P0HMV0_NEZVI|nr:unnamed protein product [Nezara viridula]